MTKLMPVLEQSQSSWACPPAPAAAAFLQQQLSQHQEQGSRKPSMWCSTSTTWWTYQTQRRWVLASPLCCFVGGMLLVQ
jgi:hypothetical protein